jgi:hypothetical protein
MVRFDNAWRRDAHAIISLDWSSECQRPVRRLGRTTYNAEKSREPCAAGRITMNLRTPAFVPPGNCSLGLMVTFETLERLSGGAGTNAVSMTYAAISLCGIRVRMIYSLDQSRNLEPI